MNDIEKIKNEGMLNALKKASRDKLLKAGSYLQRMGPLSMWEPVVADSSAVYADAKEAIILAQMALTEARAFLDAWSEEVARLAAEEKSVAQRDAIDRMQSYDDDSIKLGGENGSIV